MSTSKWVHFVRQCLLHRTHGDEFRELAELMNEKSQIHGRTIIKTIIECRQSFSISSDPLIPQYVRAAVTSGLSQTSDVMFVLIQNWNSNQAEQGLFADVEKSGNLSSLDALIVNDLALITADKLLPNVSEVRKSLSLASRWLVTLIRWISEDAESRSYLILTLLEALGIFFASMVLTEEGMRLLASTKDSGKHSTRRSDDLLLAQLIPFPLDFRSRVIEALETALPVLSSSVHLHTRLDMIQKHFNLFRPEIAKETDDIMQNAQSTPNTLQFEAGIVPESNVHARASLYMHMNAAVSFPLLKNQWHRLMIQLCGRPLLEDALLMGYLNMRYAVCTCR